MNPGEPSSPVGEQLGPWLSFIATGWHSPIEVSDGIVTWRLRNWYMMDRGFRDYDDFTWGYRGIGCTCTAYSLLRELYGRAMAEEYTSIVLDFIESLGRDAGWRITSQDLANLIDAYEFRRTGGVHHAG